MENSLNGLLIKRSVLINLFIDYLFNSCYYNHVTYIFWYEIRT